MKIEHQAELEAENCQQEQTKKTCQEHLRQPENEMRQSLEGAFALAYFFSLLFLCAPLLCQR